MARPIRDSLPAVGVTRLRATGAITLESTSIKVAFGTGPDALEREIRVVHRLFPSGGSWSFFVCPSCLRRARILRLHDGRIVCWRCDGLIYACQANKSRKTRTDVIERLTARLQSGKTNRARVERLLRRALIVERRKRLGLSAHG